MAWSALNILKAVKNNPKKGKHSYCCTVLQMHVAFLWDGSGDRELPNPAPEGCLVAQHEVRGYEGYFDTFLHGLESVRCPGSDSFMVFRVTYRILRESGVMDGHECCETVLQTKISLLTVVYSP